MNRNIIPSAGPSITGREVQVVAEAVRNGWYQNMTKYVDEFEAEFSRYTGMKYCLATSNCTSAIHLALLGLGIGPGDEVIVPDITWVASAAPICYLGATPVFGDIDRKNWCLSPSSFESRITRKTKAVVVVGLLGNLPRMEDILSIAKQHRIAVVEDAAEAMGTEYKGKKAGTFGRIGVYSFNGTKIMVTGEGGMIVTNNRSLFERFKSLSHHGMIRRKNSKLYWAEEIGYKYKMSNIQAALGLVQLSRMNELVRRRRQIFSWYYNRLRGVDDIELNNEEPGVKSTFWIVAAIIGKKYGIHKEKLMQKLEQYNIAARPFFYPLSSMPPFLRYCRGRDMRKVNPVSYDLSPYGICLPSAFSLSEKDVGYVCNVLLNILTKGG